MEKQTHQRAPSSAQHPTPSQSAGCKARAALCTLPSVPVGQGETGPSYPGRYKAHRCKCREHLRLPPQFGSTHLPAGSSQSTVVVRKRGLMHPTHTTAYVSLQPSPTPKPRGAWCVSWRFPNRFQASSSIPKVQPISKPPPQLQREETQARSACLHTVLSLRGNPHLSLALALFSS